MTYETAGLAPGLEAFVAVARHQHITRAAEELGVPQPTVSRTMARLSQQCGVPLIRPDGRGVRLTRHGQLLAGYADRALAALTAGVRTIQADADPDTGTVVLGFLHSLGPGVIPALLHGFRREHPSLRISLVQDGTDALITGTAEGEIDLCIAAPSSRQPLPGLKTRPLANQPIVALLPEGHRLAAARHLRLAQVVREPLIAMKRGYGLRTLTDELLSAAHLPTRYSFESQDITTAAGLVAAGLGIALLPSGSGAEGTTEVPIVGQPRRTVSVIWPSQRQESEPARHLRRYVIEHATAMLSNRPIRGLPPTPE